MRVGIFVRQKKGEGRIRSEQDGCVCRRFKNIGESISLLCPDHSESGRGYGRMLYTNPSLSDKDEIKKYTSNFTKEYIIRVLEAQAAGVTVTAEEAAQLEEQFETDYENAKSVDGKTLDKEEFYKYYYGITEDEYKEFWRNWFLIDKYTTICEQNADVGEDAQRQAFEEYYDYLYCYNTSVIPLYIDAANSKEQQTEKANAILASLNEGADFAELLRENSTDQELIDDAGAMKFYPVNKYEYGEVYDWLRDRKSVV